MHASFHKNKTNMNQTGIYNPIEQLLPLGFSLSSKTSSTMSTSSDGGAVNNL